LGHKKRPAVGKPAEIHPLKMQILFVAFEFPPLNRAGVYRPLKFVKYLPQFGIQPVVVTIDRDSCLKIFKGPMDGKLLNQLPAEIEIEHIPCPQPGRPVFPGAVGKWLRVFFSLFDDEAKYWRANLTKALPNLIEKHQIQAMVVTMPPFSMAPWACLASRKFKLPVLLDFRDAWSLRLLGPYRSWVHYWLTLRLERQCLTQADRVICTAEQTRLDFLHLHPEVSENKIEVILNGYDAPVDDWSIDLRPSGKQFRIGYVGSFYYDPGARESMMRPWWRKRLHRKIQHVPRVEDWLYQSPYFFFQAVARLLEKYPECRERLRIRFAGLKLDWMEAQVTQFGLAGMVEFVGQLDHCSVLAFQKDCDALLVTSSKVIGGRDYKISSKIFEYFTMRKPILGFTTEGDQKDLLVASGMAVLCDPDSPDAAAETIRHLIDGRIQLRPNSDFLKRLHRKELTRQLAEIIHSVVQRANPRLSRTD